MDLEQRVQERERLFNEIADREKVFIFETIRDRLSLEPSPNRKVLDFGCGRGVMVDYLHSLGYDSFGCDISTGWEKFPDSPVDRLGLISMEPYRLPYEDNTFDVVFSTSVLEHAKNQEVYFTEIHRVLKVGGVSMHLFPGKWFLPYEPHTHIPLLNYFWPHCPKWWINLWLMVRAVYSPEMAPYRKSVLQKYSQFCDTDIIYVPNKKYRQMSMKIFGNYGSLMDYYIDRSGGGYARLARKLPFRSLSAWFSSNFRMNYIYQRKEA
jgi:SAM-dependent methyltransferase